MKQVALGCLGVLAGLIIGVVLSAGYFNLTARPIIPPLVPAPNASRTDISVTASATFVNSQIQQSVRQSGLLKQATVTLDAPNVVRIAATVDTTVLGQRITSNVTATMRVIVTNGRIVLSIEKIDTGNLAVPQSLVSGVVENLRTLAEDEINRLIQRGLQGTNLRVVNVRFTSVEMTLDLISL